MPKVGDKIVWKDADGTHTGEVVVVMSVQLLVLDAKGVERFVFKNDLVRTTSKEAK